MRIDIRHQRTLVILLAGGLLGSLAGCNPMSAFLMNNTGLAYYNAGDFTAARREFQRAVADSPQNADYIYNLASAARKQGQTAEAEQYYLQALKLDPGHQPSYHGLSRLMIDTGRQANAAELLQTWATAETYRPEPHIELAWLHRESGDIAGAERHLLNALKTSPSHPVVTAHLGQLYQDSGQATRAAAMYQRSLFSDWYQPEVRSRLATLRDPGTANTFAAQPTLATPTYTTAQPVPQIIALPAPMTATAQPAPQPSPGPVATQPSTPQANNEAPIVAPK